MLPQQFQKSEPSNKMNIFMEKAGWTIVGIVCTMIATVVGLVWIGNIHVLDFNWSVLAVALLQVFITIFLVWYYVRTARRLQKKYQADLAALQKEKLAFKAELRNLFQEERARWDTWSVYYTQANAIEQKERLEEVKKQCMEAVSDAKTAFDSGIKNTESIFTGAVKSYEGALDSQKRYLLEVMQAKLEEMLTARQLPNAQEDVKFSSEKSHNEV